MPPLYVVHRGGAAQWPENSLLAFRNAIAGGARLLEMDVHLTADGEVAVIHDPTLDRTTNATGRVDARTAAELRQVRLRGGDGQLTTDGVPLLDDVLPLAAPAGVALLVELKTPDEAVSYAREDGAVRAIPGRRYEGLEAAVLDKLRAAGVAERSTVMAFNPAIVAEVRRRAPAQRTALLVEREHVEAAGAGGAEAVAWAAAAGVTFLGVHYRLCDADVIAAARAAGVAVGVFTVNDEDDMRRLAAIGVDVIITDRPDLALRMQAEA